ncbi:MAG: thermonuclease family protein, partial [Planctomycetota bacterium]
MKDAIGLTVAILVIVGICVFVFFNLHSGNVTNNSSNDALHNSADKPDFMLKDELPPRPGRVSRILDGDRIVLEDGRKIRLLFIDAPERSPQGFDAPSYTLRQLALSRLVSLEADPGQPDIDEFGDLLRYVHHDGVNVNVEMVRRGHADYVPSVGNNSVYAAEFEEAALAAAPVEPPEYIHPEVDDEFSATPKWRKVYLPPEDVVPGVFYLSPPPVEFDAGWKECEEWESKQTLLERGLIERLPEDNRLLGFSCRGRDSLNDRHMKALGHVPELQTLKVYGSEDLTDDGIAHMHKMTHLTELRLMGCRSITDKSMHTVGSLKRLTELDLRSTYNLTDAGLFQLSRLANLEFLDISNCENLTDVSLQYVGGFNELRYLNVSNLTSITDDGLSRIAPHGKLRHLDVCSCELLTGSFIRHMNVQNELHTLLMAQCKGLSSQGIMHLPNLTSLIGLSLAGAVSLTDEALSYISQLEQLRELELNSIDRITDEGIA